MKHLSSDNSPTPLSPDDPRLTALALGELHDPVLEAAVAADPTLQAEIAQIRQLSQSIESALKAEAESPVAQSEAAPATSDADAASGGRDGSPSRPRNGAGAQGPRTAGRGKVVDFYPRRAILSVIGGTLAACFIVSLGLMRSGFGGASQEEVGIDAYQKNLIMTNEGLEAEARSLRRAKDAALAAREADLAASEEVRFYTRPQGTEVGSPLVRHPVERLRQKGDVNELDTPGLAEPSESLSKSKEALSETVELPGSRSLVLPDHSFNREAYDSITENAFLRPLDEPLSTFSIDVDTASYANVRRMLRSPGTRVPPGAVRIEEFINYFDYDYAPPVDRETPFAVHMEATRAPWAPTHQLVRIGLKGYEVPWSQRPASNLVFLVDVSGSMQASNKLPLVQQGLKLLVSRLDERDRVALVTYAGGERLALPGTTANNRETIAHAIDNLSAGGSTNGAGGIRAAYAEARRHFIEGGVNRVILCTDGDFNVGMTSRSELAELIQSEAKSGVFLSIYGFGMGNYQDATLEELSNKGNGNYGYVDSLDEARKVFVKGASGNLITIAKDVKIQVEFNPDFVQAYRLIGYENRKLAAEDFNDDTKDAGEIGAGHTVTALYEIVPVGVEMPKAAPGVDPLKYQENPQERPVNAAARPARDAELLTVKLRYKLPDADTSSKLELPLKLRDIVALENASESTRWASAVAAFGMLLRGSAHAGDASIDSIRELADEALGVDPDAHRLEFFELLELSRGRFLQRETNGGATEAETER